MSPLRRTSLAFPREGSDMAPIGCILRLTDQNFHPNRTGKAGAPAIDKEVAALAKDDRGTKREDPETGKKFYDLNKDPIVSPYTGKSYPRSYFEQASAIRAKAAPERAATDDDDEEEEVEEVEQADAAAP